MRQTNLQSSFRSLIFLFGVAILGISSSVIAGSSKPAPDFTLQARAGAPVSLSKLRGQVVMLNFWASFCGPCRQEMPLLDDIQKKYKSLGFTLLGVNVDDDVKDANAYLAKFSKPMSFQILLDQQHKVREQYASYGEVMPMSVFIDRKGNIRDVHRGYKPGDEGEYLNQIRTLLRE